MLCRYFNCVTSMVALLLLQIAVSAQNAPNAVEVVRAGKLATALVDLPDGEGSAYCVNAAGLFATDAHVVEGYNRVKLVLFPGEREQIALAARVSHSDTENDMALLVVDPPLAQQAPQLKLTALPLGNDDDLYETLPIAVFGFPLGKLLALNERDLPSVTVSTGHVTALRKQNGVLRRIQLDAAVNPGNSGGPVLNFKGEVIGMIESQIEGAEGLNFAIPVNMVRRLITMPELVFRPEPVPVRQLFNTPREYTVRVLPPVLPLAAMPEGTRLGNYNIEFQIGDGEKWRDVIPASQPALAKLPGEAVFRVAFTLDFRDGWGQAPQYKIMVKQEGKTLSTTTGEFPLLERGRTAPGNFFPPRTAPDFGNFGGFGRPGDFGGPGAFGGQAVKPFNGPVLHCPTNDHWFQLVVADRSLTWEEAKAAAERARHQDLPGHLATITTPEEQAIVRQIAAQLPPAWTRAWLGGFQPPGSPEPNGAWQWITGEAWNYTAWNRGEPNNAGNENLLQLTNDGGWNDGDAKTTAAYIVEFEPLVKGSPTSPTTPPSPPLADSPPCVAVPFGLVAWWRMENSVSSLADDYKGSLRNGATFVQGKVGQALSFDGVNDYAMVPYDGGFNFAPNGQFTIEAWVRLEANNKYKALIVKSPPGGEWDWGLWCDNNNRFVSGHHNESAALSKTVAQSGVWYHVAVTYQGGQWKMYVDGVLESQTANIFITQSAGGVALGRKGEEPTTIGEPGYFKGLLDEPAVYNRALTTLEIKGLFNAGSVGKCAAR